jgi:DNA repair exonuclease SbcCD ATPase subunit
MSAKLSIAIMLFYLLFPLFLSSQENIEVTEQIVNMSQGEQPAYIVKVPESDYDQVLKEWEKIIRQDTKSKVEEYEHEIVIKGTHISSIYHKPINIYSAVINKDSAVKIVAVYEIDSVFFSFSEERPDLNAEKTHHHIEKFMREFAVDQYKYAVSVALSDAEKLLKTKNKELNDLSKQNENYQKEVKESEQNIKSSEDLISSYEKDSERKLSEINSKKDAIAGLSDDAELSSQAKDQLKALEKEKKNIGNKLEKEQKNIVKNESNIEELNRLIEDNTEKQTAKKTEIESQENVVDAIKAKLAGIK